LPQVSFVQIQPDHYENLPFNRNPLKKSEFDIIYIQKITENGGTDDRPPRRAFAWVCAAGVRQCFVLGRFFKYYYLPNSKQNLLLSAILHSYSIPFFVGQPSQSSLKLDMTGIFLSQLCSLLVLGQAVNERLFEGMNEGMNEGATAFFTHSSMLQSIISIFDFAF
jgi:hypothetical protein